MGDPLSPTNFDNDEDCGSSDSDECTYYNLPKFTPPPPQPQRTPRIIDGGSSLSPTTATSNTRPIPPPRRRSNNAMRESTVPSHTAPEPPAASDSPSRVTQNRNYEMHALRNTIASEPESPYQVNNGAADDDLNSYPWYWKDISRGDAEQMLKNYADGSFLVRDSTTPGDYTLTVRKDGQSKCLKIYQKDGSFGLKMNECMFNSLSALIEHYSHHTLADFNRRLDTKLVSCLSRKPGKKSANRYESLSTLADQGRILQNAKQEYIKKKEQQVKYSRILNSTQIQERAYMTAKAMFSELLAPAPSRSDDFVIVEELSQERREILEENKKLVIERQAVIEGKAETALRAAEHMELMCNNATIAMNDHVEVLRDAEENCANIRAQILEEGGKRELVECLLEECTSSHPERPLWLVDCTREEAIEYLQAEPAGTFLIRPKNDDDKPYALSIVSGNEDGTTTVKHCVIHHPAGRGYGFRAEVAVFESIDELVLKHGKTSIKVYFTHMDTCLDHPILGERPRSLGELSDSSQFLDVMNGGNPT